MKIILAPNSLDVIPKNNKHVIFLAGSIEQGKASLWQEDLIKYLKAEHKKIKLYSDMDLIDYFILNPRRKIWNAEWKQTIENKHFNRQVNWEIDGLELADKVIFYFDPNTKSPISLLELGFIIGNEKINADIICPKNFYRRGNVEIICDRFSHSFYESINDFKNNYKIPIKYRKGK